MNEMEMNNRGDYRGGNYRGGSYRDDYRDDYRDGYRDSYRDNYRRDYDRRGGRINYRNYREEDYYEELENCMHELKEYSRALEDLADMAENPQDRNMIMRIAQKEKEHYMNLKQMMEK